MSDMAGSMGSAFGRADDPATERRDAQPGVTSGKHARRPGDAGWWGSLKGRIAGLFATGPRPAGMADAGNSGLFDAAAIVDPRQFADALDMAGAGQRATPADFAAHFPAPPLAIQDARREAEAIVARALHGLQERMAPMVSHLESLRLTDPTVTIEGEYARTKDALTRLLESIRIPLQRIECDLADAVARMNLFKHSEGLTRDVREPPHWTVAVAWSLGFLAVESAVNCSFFADANSHGAAGGAFVAGAAALVNVAASSMAGFTFGRQCMRKAMLPRLIGCFGTAAFVVLVIFSHAGWSVLRHQLVASGADPITLGQAAGHLGDFRTWSSAAADGATWFLFAAGLLVSALCFAEGLTNFSDVYPGFLPHHRRIQHLEFARDDLLEALTRQMEQLHHGLDATLHDLRQTATERVAEFERLGRVLDAQWTPRWDQFVGQGKKALLHAIAVYRDTAYAPLEAVGQAQLLDGLRDAPPAAAGRPPVLETVRITTDARHRPYEVERLLRQQRDLLAAIAAQEHDMRSRFALEERQCRAQVDLWRIEAKGRPLDGCFRDHGELLPHQALGADCRATSGDV